MRKSPFNNPPRHIAEVINDVVKGFDKDTMSKTEAYKVHESTLVSMCAEIIHDHGREFLFDIIRQVIVDMPIITQTRQKMELPAGFLPCLRFHASVAFEQKAHMPPMMPNDYAQYLVKLGAVREFQLTMDAPEEEEVR